MTVSGDGNFVFLDADDLGQNQNIEDLADLGGLDVKGQERKIKPALVAAALGAPDFQHADKQHAENQQQLSPLCDDIDVNERQKDVNNDAENERERLCADIPGVSDIICGAGDDHDAEDRRCDAQREKNHIRFSDKLPDGPEYFTQSRHLPAKSYKIVTSHYSKFCAVCKPKVLEGGKQLFLCNFRAGMVR